MLVDILLEQGREILGTVSPDGPPSRAVLRGLPHFSRDEDVLAMDAGELLLVNGLGSLPGSKLRFIVRDLYAPRGFRFETVISNTATISKFAEIGEGSQIMHGAIIQSGANLGAHSIINTGAIIEHDCKIGADNHIAPGATLSGQVVTGERVHIGTGASVTQCVTIGERSVIGAGAAVAQDIPPSQTVYPSNIERNS